MWSIDFFKLKKIFWMVLKWTTFLMAMAILAKIAIIVKIAIIC